MTGATGGIGMATARLFAARGYRVFLSARRADLLAGLCDELSRSGGQALAVAADLADPEAPASLVAAAVEAYGRLHVLVNNAGFGSQCRFEDMPSAAVARIFAVNVLAPMAAARAAVPVMRLQGGGSIVNVASVGGVVAHPLNVAYCASKHALVGFSLSLRLELAGTGIRVAAVCPGATRTGFFEAARGEIPFAPFIERFSLPPETVARSILRATRSDQALLFPSLGARLLFLFDRWLPALSEAGNRKYRDQVLRAAEACDPARADPFVP